MYSAPNPTAEKLGVLLAQREPHPGIVGHEGGAFSFDPGVIGSDPEAAASAALALVLSFVNGSQFGAVRDRLAADVIGEAAADANMMARAHLAFETATSSLQLADKLAAKWSDTNDWLDEQRGIHRWDAVAIDFLQALGKEGKNVARIFREDSEQRAQWLREGDPRLAYNGHAASSAALWKLWYHPDRPLSCVWAQGLAQALWVDKVKPELERLKHRRPAVVRAVVSDRILPMMTRQLVHPELDDGIVRDDKGRQLGRISLTTEATLEAVRNGASALGTVAGNRLIRTLIHRSHDAWNRGEQDPRNVSFEGGWEGLLEALRTPSKYHSLLKQIAMAGQCIVWETAHAKHGGLWMWSERRGTKAARGEVSFVLGDALTPGYSDILSREGDTTLPARIARRLVPELRYEPPMGRAREHDRGAIWTLHRLMLVELVDHSEELAKQGYTTISDARWKELADRATLPRSIIDRTLQAWTAGEDEHSPPLVKRADDGWTLADIHKPERDFIEAGGAKRSAGRKTNKAKPRTRKAK